MDALLEHFSDQLAPDIVEGILEDALPDQLTLFDLAVDTPVLWEEQRLRIW